MKKVLGFLMLMFLLVLPCASSVMADDSQDYLDKLSFQKKSTLRLGKLDNYGRPTGLRIFYRHDFPASRTYKDTAFAYNDIPGYQLEEISDSMESIFTIINL